MKIYAPHVVRYLLTFQKGNKAQRKGRGRGRKKEVQKRIKRTIY